MQPTWFGPNASTQLFCFIYYRWIKTKRSLIGLVICRFQLSSENMVWLQSQKALTQLRQLEWLSPEMWPTTPSMPWLVTLSTAPSGYSPFKSSFIFSCFCHSLLLSTNICICWLQREWGSNGHRCVQRQSLPECPEQDVQLCWCCESQQRGTWERKRSTHRVSLAFLLVLMWAWRCKSLSNCYRVTFCFSNRLFNIGGFPLSVWWLCCSFFGKIAPLA